ncbi:Na+/H+ antiporter NhaC family protein, partial [Staphylococcus pseudintermedius]|uniref:Na+/H+ antiporter NhaC family protein n=1 Tax=Staphylococcus pseudintermedius TaxID=283734 RepID=UPI000E38963F
FTSVSGNKTTDEMFNRCGHESMFYPISLKLVAMTFGGLQKYSGMLKALISVVLKFAKNTDSLIASVIISCVGTNLSCSKQYISIIVPSRMYVETFIDKG